METLPPPNDDYREDNVIRPKGWKPMTTEEAERILAEEEEWPPDPSC